MSLCCVSSGLYILSFPNWNLSYFAWFALVPLSLISLSARLSVPIVPDARNVPDDPRAPQAPRDVPLPHHPFLYGWLSGTLAYCGLLSWLIDTFKAAHLSLALALPCLIALSAYLGLFWGAWSWFINWTSSPAGAGRRPINLFVGAAAWVALEYLRTYLFSGFPWVLLADSQVQHLPVIQIASITGSYGISCIVVLTNLALAGLIQRGLTQRSNIKHLLGQTPAVAYIAALGLTPLCLLFGFWKLHASPQPTADPSHAPSSPRPYVVSLLQGNIDQYKKWDEKYVAEIKARYSALVSQAATQKPDLIIWPETSVPGYLLQDPPLRTWLTQVTQNSKTYHLIGSPHYENKSSYNSAFSLNPEGHLEGEYSKKHLVPFGEIVPWSNLLGRWISVLNELGGFTPGTLSPVLTAGPLKLGVNICYEAIFPDLVRRSVKAGAEVVVNITNDAWYMDTAAPYQHLAPNIYRAVENRRWVLRANNTGVSAIIDPHGRVMQSTPIFEPAVVTGNVVPISAQTLYTRTGDLFAWICLVFCAIFRGRAILRPS